ncbi:hypothetical protein QWJ26_31150 [Streptomyces sp. CSDS2]|uniref:hypothetical protein n=1 Tax=Streptomyces sp. CSDS2 TaxID=3055051 RepID=UPI0025B12E9B|nr:hypothetical protein [Streptomyces sp. CSDS2]MDN3264192.1 hypothetical protein [Streptomyces sp. CSDS2]
MTGWLRRRAAKRDHEAMLRQRVDHELLKRTVTRGLAEVRRTARGVRQPAFAAAAEEVIREAEQTSTQFMIDAIVCWNFGVRGNGLPPEDSRRMVVREYLRWRARMDECVRKLRRYADQAQ